MPQISSRNKDKISEQVLSYLFSTAPDARFTSDIAGELARDEEFIKTILQDLYQKKLVVQVNQNPEGKEYSRRQRWRLSNQAYDAYKKIQQ
jgi:hypothetical protein